MTYYLKLLTLEEREVPAVSQLFANFIGEVTDLPIDVNDDGVVDLVAAPMVGGGPHIKVIDGKTGAEWLSFFAYAPEFHGGISLGVGDINGDGRADIITGAGIGGGPHVQAFSGVDGSELFNGFAFDSNLRGGVFVASGDFDNDGRDDIVTGAGDGSGPHVRCFNVEGNLIGNTMIGDVNSRRGIRVGCQANDSSGPVLLTAIPGESRGQSYRGFSGQLLNSDVPNIDPNSSSMPNEATKPNVVTIWNDLALRAIRAEKTAPPRAALALAIVHTAIFDAVNAIEGGYESYLPQAEAPRGASSAAAAIETAFRTMSSLFPTRVEDFQKLRDTQLGTLSEPGNADGIVVGAAAAAGILTNRASDQPTAMLYTPGSEPSQL